MLSLLIILIIAGAALYIVGLVIYALRALWPMAGL